ncbi:MAG: hypothetical protein ABSF64_36605 [Bryobacteraceae bacterium]|jgi:hypothetical protein
MPARSVKQDDPLEDFAVREISLNGIAKRVYIAGTGLAAAPQTTKPGIWRYDESS